MAQPDIIIVEDDALVGEISQSILTDAGYAVQWVQDSREAEAAIKAAMPRLVITDIMMPGITGMDICKGLKSEPQLKHIKVLVVSAKSFEAEKRRAYMFGADGFLPKPFSAKLMLETVMGMIQAPAK